MFFFFFNDTATTEIYTLSLHDALPIFHKQMDNRIKLLEEILSFRMQGVEFDNGDMYVDEKTERSEERFSRNAETDLVCRLLLEKKRLHQARIIAVEIFRGPDHIAIRTG